MRGGNYVLALIFMDVDDHEISPQQLDSLDRGHHNTGLPRFYKIFNDGLEE